MRDDPIVYIVIVNFGRAGDTIECLQSLYRLDNVKFRVVLIDNGSPDRSGEVLAKWLGLQRFDAGWTTAPVLGGNSFDIKFIRNPKNVGFAGGCNIGISEALASENFSYVWLLNNDTIVNSDSLSELVKRAEKSDTVGMVGSTLVYFKPSGILQGCGGYFSLAHGRGGAMAAGRGINELPEEEDVEPNLDYIIGASLLVSKSVLQTVGIMDERYFLYFEELDWALRARKYGFDLAWAKRSTVIHKEGAAIGTSTRGRPSAMAMYFMTVGYCRILYKHRPYLLPLGLALTALRSLKWAIKGDRELFVSVISGVRDFVKHPTGYKLGSYRGIGAK